jgi:hypothetical protein
MKITSQKTFGISAAMLLLAFFQYTTAQDVLNTTATRDFNFGPPLLIVLSIIQGVIAVIGIALSVSRGVKHNS